MTKTPTAELRLRLFGGKGGVGKTTCAAAFAVAEARRGARVLVASTDPAHSLADALGLGSPRDLAGEKAAEPRPVPGVAGLTAVEIDSESAWRRWLEPKKATLAAIAERGTYFSQQDLAPLLELRLPGVDELLGLLETLGLAREARADCVVVDTAPTGHTLRLLEMPASLDAFASVLDAMEERQRALAEAFGRGERGGLPANDSAASLISDLRSQAGELHDLLRDPDRTAISWVLLPEPLAIQETESALRRLSARNLTVTELVVNRVAPADDACAEALGRIRAERDALAATRRLFPGLPLRIVTEATAEPIGPEALIRLDDDPGRFATDESATASPGTTTAASTATRTGTTGLGPAPPEARLVLVGGKGGVGKSTCAAAVAVAMAGAMARSGEQVDLVSTDPAPSLAYLFGCEASPAEPTPVDSALPGLRVQELDAEARFAGFRQRLLENLDRVTRRGDERAGGALPVERSVFEALVAATPPGLDEMVALGELVERVGGASSRRLVVDLSPTGHALRLLEMPDLALTWIRAVMKLLLDYRQVFGLGALAHELLALSKSVQRVQRLLADPSECVFVAVTRAASLPISETRRLLARLDRLGVAVDSVVVNALVPAGAGPCASQRQRQDAWLATLAESVGSRRAILLAPIRFPRPEGVEGLRAWHEQWVPFNR